MNFIFILFGFSLFGIVIMIFFRAVELKKKKFVFSNKIRACADKFLLYFCLVLKKNTVKIKIWILNEFHLIPKKIGHRFSLIWRKIRDKIDNYFNHFHTPEINGKVNISNYWRKVSEHKEISSKNKIEAKDKSN